LLLALAPLPWLGVGAASATPPDDEGEHKITICHRTNAVSNPYVVIDVDIASADGLANEQGNQADHYGEHVGLVFDPEAEYTPPMSGDEWGDIIPPIEGAHDGLNWTDEGIAIWENGCAIPTPTPSETTPTPTPTGTTPTPTPSGSTSAPVEEKVTLCHATAAVKNPYVVITVAVSAADGDLGNDKGKGDHYAEHNGPLFDPEVNSNGDDWGDIIPPIDGIHDGLNWTDEGMALWEAGCKVATPTPTPTETTPTPTPTETTPTPTPSGSETEPGEKPTKKPSVLPTRSERPGELPQTGSELPVGSALAASLLLIGLGGLLLVGPGRVAADRYQQRH
jgi:hypothetical protein